jgi:S1-C subfamily serine protease
VIAIVDDNAVTVVDSDEDGRGWLGVHIQDLSSELSEVLEVDEEGVLVSDVGEDSPAEKSGIEPRDVILSINGERVRDVDELMEVMSDTRPGDTATLEIIHEGDRKTIEIILGEQPSSDIRAFTLPHLGDPLSTLTKMVRGPQLGVQVEEPNEDLASYFGISEGEGVLVMEVYEDSAAEEAGILAGDVILKVDGEEISSAASLREALAEAGEGEVSIRIRRKGKEMDVTAELEEREALMERFIQRHGDSPRWEVYRDRLHKGKLDREVRKKLRHLQRDLRHSGRELRDDLRDEMREMRREMEKLKKEMQRLKENLERD